MDEPEWSIPPLESFAWAQPIGAVDGNELGSLDESHTGAKVLEYTELGLHFAGLIGEMTEMFHVEAGTEILAGGEVVGEGTVEAGALVAGAEALAPLGSVVTVFVTAKELYAAFTTTQRIEHSKGMAYGLMWEVLKMPDTERTTRPGPFGAEEMTASELEAWHEGVEEGRKAAREDPEVREEIMRSISYEMAAQHRDLATDPQHAAWKVAVEDTLERIWDKTRPEEGPEGRVLAGSALPWLGESDGSEALRVQH